MTTESDFIFAKNLLTLEDMGYIDEEDESLKLEIKQYAKSRKLLEDVENVKDALLWISALIIQYQWNPLLIVLKRIKSD